MNPTELKKPIHVMKFGGTSVATPALIQNAAHRISERQNAGVHVVCVVSAMGDTTDQLLSLAREISERPPSRELDVLLSAGEVQSMALLSMALHEKGIAARSFTGSQGGIRTNTQHSEAKILHIDPDRIVSALARDEVVVLAGFQGHDERDEITTLGRGGSDTSAVAMAAALGADLCEILTDVSGVFTADPRIVDGARQIRALGYDEMLEMANLGAKVLHGRSVEMARRFQVPLVVASATQNAPGTRISRKEDDMEKVEIRAVTDDRNVKKISLVSVPDTPGVAAKIFGILGELGVNVRLIVQAQSHDGNNDITFVVPGDTHFNDEQLDDLVKQVGGENWIVDERIALLNIIGEGISREPGIAGSIFQILAAQKINLDLISSSNLVITCVVPEEDLIRGTRALHEGLIETDASTS
ncbi:aspartate kinase [bacterium TMED181]|nr:aspartate kinase [Planctomycetota bacterium]OUW47009.1 MAG: aspartate kinase [bacterium TMED181]